MKRTKYGRTPHHPLSEEIKNDDKVIKPEYLKSLYGMEMVATLKADGECTTNYPDGYSHCRSIDSSSHESNSWVRGFAKSIGYTLHPMNRICGENLYAKHSIEYNDLTSYFYCFNVWNNDNVAISWDETKEFCRIRNIHTVTEVWRGVLTEQVIKDLWNGLDLEANEGLVFRVAGEIPYEKFEQLTFKLVREGHVQTDKHWKQSEIVKNTVIEGGQSNFNIEPLPEYFDSLK